jgi:hypothetical protein
LQQFISRRSSCQATDFGRSYRSEGEKLGGVDAQKWAADLTVVAAINDEGSTDPAVVAVNREIAKFDRGEKAVCSVGTSQEREIRSHLAPCAQPLVPE